MVVAPITIFIHNLPPELAQECKRAALEHGMVFKDWSRLVTYGVSGEPLKIPKTLSDILLVLER